MERLNKQIIYIYIYIYICIYIYIRQTDRQIANAHLLFIVSGLLKRY